MNRIERPFVFGQEAKIRYLDGEFQVLKNGSFVRCSVTGEPIRIRGFALLERGLPGALHECGSLAEAPPRTDGLGPPLTVPRREQFREFPLPLGRGLG